MEEEKNYQSSTKQITYNDLIKQNIDIFPKPLTDNHKFIVKKNLDDLVELSLKDIKEFIHTNFVKYKALCVLQNLIFFAEGAISKHSAKIIEMLIKYLFFEDSNISAKVSQISKLLGAYVSCDIFIPIVINQIKQCDQNAIRTLASTIVQLYSFFQTFSIRMFQANQLSLKMMIQQEIIQSPQFNKSLILSKIIGKKNNLFEFINSEHNEIMIALYNLVDSIIQITEKKTPQYERELFSILLAIQSSPTTKPAIGQRIHNSMEQLSIKCGYKELNELYSNQINIMLTELEESKSYTKWHKFSHSRFKFDLIIRNCKEGIEVYLSKILEIIATVTNPANDIELRMDMLILIEFILKQEVLKEKLQKHSFYILTKILIPSSVWRVGKPNIKIRKAAIINMITLTEYGIIQPQPLQESFKDLIPIIKSCLNDDWGPDLRFATCNLLEKLLISTKEIITTDDLRELYPALLERLDDAQDQIRIEITKSSIAFFDATNLKLSPSVFEYMIKAIILHLDDQNEDLRNEILKILKHAVKIDPQYVMSQGQLAETKHTHKMICKELINYADEFIKSII